jgi:hypothetical protein
MTEPPEPAATAVGSERVAGCLSEDDPRSQPARDDGVAVLAAQCMGREAVGKVQGPQFSDCSSQCYILGDHGATVASTYDPWFRPALCGGTPMSHGRHYCEFELEQCSRASIFSVLLGVSRAKQGSIREPADASAGFWGVLCHNGAYVVDDAHAAACGLSVVRGRPPSHRAQPSPARKMRQGVPRRMAHVVGGAGKLRRGEPLPSTSSRQLNTARHWVVHHAHLHNDHI